MCHYYDARFWHETAKRSEVLGIRIATVKRRNNPSHAPNMSSDFIVHTIPCLCIFSSVRKTITAGPDAKDLCDESVFPLRVHEALSRRRVRL